MGRLILILLASVVLSSSLQAAPAGTGASEFRFDRQQVLARSEAALGTQIGDYRLTDSQGRRFSLGDYRGQPLVISLIYTSCSSVCPTTTQHLVDAVEEARRSLGTERFAVLTVGFDARHDTPARMATFARQQGIPVATWRVASGDEATLAALMRDLGFSFEAAAGGFEHVTQTSIIDAQGRLYRHVYGDDFPLQVFIEPLKEVVFGTTTRALTVSALADRIRFLCTVYDPYQGRYRTSYAIALGIFVGGLSLLISGTIFGRAWVRNLRRHRRLAAR
ncbi:MAG: SCO family protein [Variibacter sp.]